MPLPEHARDERRAARRLSDGVRTVLTVIAVLLLVISALGVVFRVQPVSSMPRLIIAVGATFLPLAAMAGLALAIACRRRALSIVGVFLLIATTVVQLSWYFTGSPTRLQGATEVRVLASNLRHGRADPARGAGDCPYLAELFRKPETGSPACCPRACPGTRSGGCGSVSSVFGCFISY